MKARTRNLVLVGLLGAMGFLLMVLLEFPIPFLFPPFLKYDFGGIPSILAALTLGPGAGTSAELVKTLLFMLSGKDPTLWVGPSAAFLAGAVMAELTGWVYRRRATTGGLALGLSVATVATAVVMSVANYLVFLPAYGIPAGQVAGMAAGVIFPFNLVKGLITGTVVMVIGRRLAAALKR
ncbi:MAG: ECF transporter S component [Chitinophagales bacterium]